MKILTAAQIREWDAFTIRHEPISSIELMERAARHCTDWILQSPYQNGNFLVCCGPGNNGGDGLVIARLLKAAGKKVAVWLLPAAQQSADHRISLQKAHEAGVPIFESTGSVPVAGTATVIVDALLGTGLNKPLSGEAARLVDAINQSGLPVISIDIPSGLFADHYPEHDPIIRAQDTLTLGSLKRSFMFAAALPRTGRVHLLDIGLHPAFPEQAACPYHSTGPAEAALLYRPRNAAFHKYQFGHALLLAGSLRMTGAAILMAEACLRSGAGLVTVQLPPERMAVLQTALPEAIATDETDFSRLTYKKAAIGAGPGWEAGDAQRRLLAQLLSEWHGPLVLDATALQLLQPLLPLLEARNGQPPILTPHAGEFDQLFGAADHEESRMMLAGRMAVHYQCCIVLKGPHTLCALPDGSFHFNTSGNSGMATAGSGDVLAGILTGLCAQGYAPADACRLGVYLHGAAGDLAAARLSPEAMIAGDITRSLGAAWQALSATASG